MPYVPDARAIRDAKAQGFTQISKRRSGGRMLGNRALVTVEIDGPPQAKLLMREMADRAANAEIYMATAATELQRAAARRARSNPWKPLTANTVARKDSQGLDSSIFRDEPRLWGGEATRTPDRLWDALTGQGLSEDTYRYFTKRAAVFGLNTKGKLFYARFLNYGAKPAQGRNTGILIPRQLLGVSEEDAHKLGVMFGMWVRHGRI